MMSSLVLLLDCFVCGDRRCVPNRQIHININMHRATLAMKSMRPGLVRDGVRTYE